MTSFKYLSLLAFTLVFMLHCKQKTNPEIIGVDTVTASKPINPNATYAKAEFNINGMTCAMGCAKTIEKKLAKIEGVKMAKVDFDTHLAMVEYDVAKVKPEILTETVTLVGNQYKVENIKLVTNFSEAVK